MTMPIRRLLRVVAKAADHPDQANVGCAIGLLIHWASKDALLAEPTDFQGARHRQRAAKGINLAILKLDLAGVNVGPVVDWLEKLSLASVRRFAKRTRMDNLQLESGVVAASMTLIKSNEELTEHAHTVFTQGISGIRDDGYVRTELERATRARVYHVAYLAGLVVLKRLMQESGISIEPEHDERVQLLATRVRESFCNPDSMAALAGVKYLDMVRPVSFAPLVTFDAARWARTTSSCVEDEVPLRDTMSGGSWERLLKLLEAT